MARHRIQRLPLCSTEAQRDTVSASPPSHCRFHTLHPSSCSQTPAERLVLRSPRTRCAGGELPSGGPDWVGFQSATTRAGRLHFDG
jgi:hypothetical protein